MVKIDISKNNMKVALGQKPHLRKYCNMTDEDYINHLVLLGVIVACNAQHEREEMGIEDKWQG